MTFKTFKAPADYDLHLSAFKEDDIEMQHLRQEMLQEIVLEACVCAKPLDVRNVIATLLSCVINLVVASRRIDRAPGGEQQEAKLLSLFVDVMNEALAARTPDEARTRARRVVDELVAWKASRRRLTTYHPQVEKKEG